MEERRDSSLDAIRVIAIVMVIALHVSAPLAVRFGSIPASSWWVANVVESLTRPAVPLFLMVSGLLLLEPERSAAIVRFLRRRLTRVLLPFLIWAGVFLLWRRYYHGEPLGLTAALLEVVAGPVYMHFWFVYVLLGLYLVTPLLQVFVRHATRGQLAWFVALWFLGSSLLPMLERLTGIGVGVGWSVVVGYVGYYLLGHALADWRLEGRQWGSAFAGVVLLVGATAVLTYLASAHIGTLSELFYGNLSPNVVALSALMFVMLRSARFETLAESARAGIAMRWLAAISFGVYLVHPAVQELLQGGVLGLSLSGLSFAAPAAIALTTAAVFVCSLLIVQLVCMLPGGRVAVGR